MRCDSLRGTLAFGAVAALATPLALHFLAGELGVRSAFASYAVGLAALYLTLLARGWRRRLRVAGIAASTALAVLLLQPSLPAAIAVAAAGIALGRPWVLEGRLRVRSLAWEIGLALSALMLAAIVSAPGPLGLALAVWTAFLVHGVFFLVRDLGVWHAPSQIARDPFEAACSQLERLLRDDAAA